MKIFRVISVCIVCGLLSINVFCGPGPRDVVVPGRPTAKSFVMGTAKMKLKVCAPNIIHVMYAPSGTFSNQGEPHRIERLYHSSGVYRGFYGRGGHDKHGADEGGSDARDRRDTVSGRFGGPY